jgi:hypothetical protein
MLALTKWHSVIFEFVKTVKIAAFCYVMPYGLVIIY